MTAVMKAAMVHIIRHDDNLGNIRRIDGGQNDKIFENGIHTDDSFDDYSRCGESHVYDSLDDDSHSSRCDDGFK